MHAGVKSISLFSVEQLFVMPKRAAAGMSRRQVMRLVAPEKKYFDDYFTWALAAGTASTAVMLGESVRTAPVAETGISTNSTVNGRIGQKIRIESMAIHMRFAVDAVAVGAAAPVQKTAMFRICLVEDKSPNGVLPVWDGTVVDGIGLASTTYGSVLAHRNLNVTQRFRILHDRVYTLDILGQSVGNAATFASPKTIKYLSIYKKFPKGVVRKYKAASTTGAPTEVEKNGHYLFILPDLTNPAALSAVAQCRLRYTDV